MAKLIALLTVRALQAGLGHRPEIETETLALWEDEQRPVHMAMVAAFGKDLDEFIENAENNNHLLAGSGFMEVNTPSISPTKEFCPEVWLGQLKREGTQVGSGAYGHVYVVKLTCSEDMVAIKVQENTTAADRESKLAMDLDHPNVIKTFDSAKGPDPDEMSLVMEVCSGGDFTKVDKKMAGSVKARLFYETLLGVAYMHGRGLVHSDIKPENVMLSSDCTSSSEKTCHSKLVDFGYTCSVNKGDDCKGLAGTPLFMAPDLLKSERRSQPDDLWSLGVMLHEIVWGSPPYFLKNFREKYEDVRSLFEAMKDLRTDDYAYKAGASWRGLSAKELLLEGLLVANAHLRLSADAAAILAKRWMKEEGADDTEANSSFTMPACWTKCVNATCDGVQTKCELYGMEARCVKRG